MVEVIWTDHAIQDLNDIGDYIGKDSVKYAELTVARLFKLPNILVDYPFLGKIVPELSNPSIKELVYGNYRLIYRVVNYERIDILTVHNCSRMVENVLGIEKDTE